MPNNKAVVLLSGGQDSTTSLFWAYTQGIQPILALSFNYGQRHVAELEAARQIAGLVGLEHKVIELGSLLGDESALTNTNLELKGNGGIIDREMPQGLPTSFVPGRNLLFLTIAAIEAAKRGATFLVTGVCQTDYSGYPDCRDPFITALEKAVNEALPSGMRPLLIRTPLMNLTKAETVKLMSGMGPLAWQALGLTMTCYEGKRPGCGKCPACELRAKGFQEAHLDDPAAK